MVEIAELPQPSLIVVTGRPGSGKSTLAHALARAVRCPAICRDEIKEGFVNTLGHAPEPGDDSALRVYEAFFDAVTLLLDRRVTLIAEAAFQHRLWAPKLEPLRGIARIRIILCDVGGARSVTSRQAWLADPAREHFHDDRAVQAAREGRELPIENYDPPRLGVPMLKVDTSDGYHPELEAIVGFVRGGG